MRSRSATRNSSVISSCRTGGADVFAPAIKPRDDATSASVNDGVAGLGAVVVLATRDRERENPRSASLWPGVLRGAAYQNRTDYLFITRGWRDSLLPRFRLHLCPWSLLLGSPGVHACRP